MSIKSAIKFLSFVFLVVTLSGFSSDSCSGFNEDNSFGKDLVLHLYPATSRSTDGTVLLLPDGDYKTLNLKNEGNMLIKLLNSGNFDVAIPEYTVASGPDTREMALGDVLKALSLLKSKHDSLGFRSNRIVVIGFCSGGHLAASAIQKLNENDQPDDLVLVNPSYMDELVEGTVFYSVMPPVMPKARLLLLASVDETASSLDRCREYVKTWTGYDGDATFSSLEDKSVKQEELILSFLSTKPLNRKGDPNPAAIAVEGGNKRRHAQEIEAISNNKYDLLMIGNSITNNFDKPHYQPVWDQFFAPRNAINLGYSGYRTENIIWNILNGEVDGQSPKVVVLEIGTNNIDEKNYPTRHTAGQLAGGIETIVKLLRKKLPKTKIIVLRCFPGCYGGPNPTSHRAILERASDIVSELEDGKYVFYCDVNHVFLNPDGSINHEMMPDWLHPSPEGQKLWAKAMEPLLSELMGDKSLDVDQDIRSYLNEQQERTIDIYVSPKGKDTNSGNIDFPFLSIERAKVEAGKFNEKTEIILREGTYYVARPVTFSPADSRNDNAALVIRAYQGEKVVISGSLLLKLKWSKYKKGIWKAHIEEDIVFDQFFVNGKLQRMARYPNYNPEARFLGGTAADAIDADRIKDYKDPEGAYVHALHSAEWGDFHYVVKGRDADGELILEGGWQNNRRMGMHKKHRFIENVFEELDTVGEWYYNSKTKNIFYYPSEKEDLKTATIEVPQISSLFEFHGTENEPVRNITIDSLELTQTLRTFMDNKEQLLRSDWTTYRGGTVFFEGAENCTVSNCYFNNVGANAVYFSNYNRYCEVSSCIIANAGASAISFVGDPAAVRSPGFEYHEFVPYDEMDLVPGPKTNNYPAECIVSNNLIYGIGYTEKQSAGVQISMSQDINISHNTIYDVPRAGINISEGTWGGHMIEYNDVFNTVLETGDHGSFNSWGRDRYWHPNRRLMDSLAAVHPELILLDAVKTTTIRNNRFRCDHGWDIDLDDGSSNYEIYNNLCLNGGLKLREGFCRTVYNNIMINNSFHPHVWFKDSKDIFIHNIVTTKYAPIRVPYWGKFVNHNLFPDSASLALAKRNNTDLNSVAGDPLFIDPVNGNFQVADRSPALEVGFMNFDMDNFGVVTPKLKRLAKKVRLPAPLALKEQMTDEISVFMGLKIKNLTTLGERSATGMSSQRGVLITEVPENSPLAGRFRPNDVIIAFNGKDVTRVSDLTRLQSQEKLNHIEVRIFRNQKEQTININ